MLSGKKISRGENARKSTAVLNRSALRDYQKPRRLTSFVSPCRRRLIGKVYTISGNEFLLSIANHNRHNPLRYMVQFGLSMRRNVAV